MRLLLSIPVVIVTLLVVALVAPNFIDWNKYKAPAREQIKTISGYDVDLKGDLSLVLLPFPALHANEVTITAPAGQIASLKTLEASVALAPLFSGKVDVSSVNLVEPKITLAVDREGSPNWMTPQLQEMTGGKKEAGQQEQGAPDDKKVDAAKSVSLQSVKIENGTFQYSDGKAGKVTVVEGITVNVKADTLSGPFDVQGRIKFDGKPVEFTAKAGELVKGAESISLKATARTGGVDVTYGGVVGVKQPYSVQGETVVKIPDLSETMQVFGGKDIQVGKINALEMSGLLTGTQEKVEYKDISAKLGPYGMDGRVVAALNPLKIESDFAVSGLPGSGNAHGTAVITLAEGGAVIETSVKGKTQDVVGLIEEFTAPGSGAALKSFKTASFDINAGISPGKTSLQNSTVTLDQSKFVLSGSMAKGKSGRDLLSVDVTAQSLDLDKFMGGSKTGAESGNAGQGKSSGGKASGGGSPQDALKNLSLPFDLEFDVGAQSAQMQDYTVKGLRAQGRIEENALSVKNLSVQDFAGTAASVVAKISNLKALDGIDADVTLQSQNVRPALSALKVKTDGLPKDLKAVKADVKATGSIDSLGMNANISALNGEFLVKGTVASPLDGLTLSNISLQVKSANMAGFIRTVAPGSPYYVSLEKPLDFYADLKQSGTTYVLENIKGNLAGASLSGKASVNTGGEKPDVTGDLKFGTLVLQSAQTQAEACCGKGKAVPSGGRWSTKPIDTAWMDMADIDLDITASGLTYETWETVNPALKFKLADGVLNITDLSAGLYDGRASLNGTVSAASSGGVSVKLVPNLSGIQLEPLVKSLVGTRLIQGSGRVDLSADIATSGKTQAALVNALQGQGTVKGEAIVIDGMDLTRFARALSEEAKPGDSLLHLWKGTTGRGSTSFDTMDGAFTINRGIVTLSKLDLDGPKAYLATEGAVNIPAWTVKTAHTITLKDRDDVPPFTINIDGPLDNPGQTFAQGAVQDYLKRKINRKLQKVIDDQLSDKVGGELGNALGGLLGGSPAQQQTQTRQAPAANDNVKQEQSGARQQGNDGENRTKSIEEEAIEGLINGLLR